jgi:hypothetical protein
MTQSERRTGRVAGASSYLPDGREARENVKQAAAIAWDGSSIGLPVW